MFFPFMMRKQENNWRELFETQVWQRSVSTSTSCFLATSRPVLSMTMPQNKNMSFFDVNPYLIKIWAQNVFTL